MRVTCTSAPSQWPKSDTARGTSRRRLGSLELFLYGAGRGRYGRTRSARRTHPTLQARPDGRQLLEAGAPEERGRPRAVQGQRARGALLPAPLRLVVVLAAHHVEGLVTLADRVLDRVTQQQEPRPQLFKVRVESALEVEDLVPKSVAVQKRDCLALGFQAIEADPAETGAMRDHVAMETEELDRPEHVRFSLCGEAHSVQLRQLVEQRADLFRIGRNEKACAVFGLRLAPGIADRGTAVRAELCEEVVPALWKMHDNWPSRDGVGQRGGVCVARGEHRPTERRLFHQVRDQNYAPVAADLEPGLGQRGRSGIGASRFEQRPEVVRLGIATRADQPQYPNPNTGEQPDALLVQRQDPHHAAAVLDDE